MNDLLKISSAKLKRIISLRKQIERLETRLEKLAAQAVPTSAPGQRRKRRKMSAAGRKAISKAAKARWAKIKAKLK
jgi:hypothetical protein